jgi:hypothetical protein
VVVKKLAAMDCERQVPLKLCVTVVCLLGAVAFTFVRVPGNVACALVCVGLAMMLPDVMIDLPKTADQLLEEALEENRALKALLKSEMEELEENRALNALLKSEMDANCSDSGTESESDSGTESESAASSKDSRLTV